METKGNKPSLGWAILSLVLPVAMILYGTLVVGVRPPVLPLIGAVALAAGLFVFFFPVLSGLPVSSSYAALLKWLPGWGFYIL